MLINKKLTQLIKKITFDPIKNSPHLNFQGVPGEQRKRLV